MLQSKKIFKVEIYDLEQLKITICDLKISTQYGILGRRPPTGPGCLIAVCITIYKVF